MRRPEFLRRLLALALLAGLATGVAAAKKPAEKTVLSEVGRVNIALASSYLAGGKTGEAEIRARKAVASDPRSGQAHAMLGIVLTAAGKNADAEKSFARALALAPADGFLRNAHGAWLCGRGDFAGADADFRLALQDPAYANVAQALGNAGRCAIRARDWIAAAGYLRRALTIAPADRGVLLMLAESELNLGRAFDARAFVQRSDALGPDAGTLALAARIEDAAGDPMSAGRYRRRLQLEFPAYAPTAEGAR
jgi:type IV pilus assembly protein PilF